MKLSNYVLDGDSLYCDGTDGDRHYIKCSSPKVAQELMHRLVPRPISEAQTNECAEYLLFDGYEWKYGQYCSATRTWRDAYDHRFTPTHFLPLPEDA